jgi:AcrR family transcriptional regulator
MVCKETMRAQILEAAKKRFVHYGYAKTTMAEIATDLNMSPGNLYRYFPGKIDIAEAIADEAAEETFVVLRQVARQPDLSAREKLKAYLQKELELTFSRLDSDPRIYEMAQFIKKERPHHVDVQLAEERKILGELLRAGIEAGEFVIDDPDFAAEMIQAATLKYRYPQLWTAAPLEKLRRELEGVLGLMVDGITPRAKPRVAKVEAAVPAASGRVVEV